MKRFVFAGALLVAGYATAVIADAPKVAVQKIFSSTTTAAGQTLDVPKHPELDVFIATFPSGARLPEHKHPFPHYAYVLEGTLTVVNTQTGKSFDVKQGEFLAEMQDTWHYGINKRAEPVKLLVIDQVPVGTKTNTVVKQGE